MTEIDKGKETLVFYTVYYATYGLPQGSYSEAADSYVIFNVYYFVLL